MSLVLSHLFLVSLIVIIVFILPAAVAFKVSSIAVNALVV